MEFDSNDTTNYARLHLQMESLYENAGEELFDILSRYVGTNEDSNDTNTMDDNIDRLDTIRAELTERNEHGRTKIEDLALALRGEKCERFTYYENLRLLVNRSIETLQQTLALDFYYRDILNKLNTRINQLENPTPQAILELEAALGTIATVRPEYLRYIQTYGMPTGGVFDTDKLAEILRELEEEGLIQNSKAVVEDVTDETEPIVGNDGSVGNTENAEQNQEQNNGQNDGQSYMKFVEPDVLELIPTKTEKITRPEFTRYIEIYGEPENGIFDPFKLAEMIREIESENENKSHVEEQIKSASSDSNLNDIDE